MPEPNNLNRVHAEAIIAEEYECAIMGYTDMNGEIHLWADTKDKGWPVALGINKLLENLIVGGLKSVSEIEEEDG